MAQEFYGVNRVAYNASSEVTTGTADTATEIQVVVKTGVGVTTIDIANAIERLKRYICEGEDPDSVWPI